jgi:hypothetical protein
MSNAKGIDREVALQHRLGITDGAIDNEAANAALDGAGKHQFSHQRVCEVSTGIDHDDVARLGHLDGLVQHEVVARARLDGQRWTGEHAALVHGTQQRTARDEARHNITDDGDRQRGEVGNGGSIHAIPGGMNAKAGGHVNILLTL